MIEVENHSLSLLIAIILKISWRKNMMGYFLWLCNQPLQNLVLKNKNFFYTHKSASGTVHSRGPLPDLLSLVWEF